MQRRGKQSKIYRTEIMQMEMPTDKESKIKYTELKHWTCQNAGTRKGK